MTTAHSFENNLHNETAVIALILAQDESYIVPLREYLHTHGCVVETKLNSQKNIRYQIVIGDLEYVKQFAHAEIPFGIQRLVLIWNLPGELKERASLPVCGKVILVDTHMLTTREVTKIFAYFFTGKEQWLDLRNPGLKQKPVTQTTIPKKIPTAGDKPKSMREDDQKRIAQIISAVYSPEKKTFFSSISFSRSTPRKKLALIFCLFSVLLAVPLSYILSLSLTVFLLLSSVTALQRGSYTQAQENANLAVYWQRKASSSLSYLSNPLNVIGLSGFIHNQERVVSFLDKASSSAKSGLYVLEDARSLGTSTLSVNENAEGSQPAAQLEQIRNEISYLQGILGLAQAELEGLVNDGIFPFSFGYVRNAAEALEKHFVRARTANAVAADGLSIYPELLGFRDEKKYLILLQNSAELRPTGGFIGSVALISFSGGKLRNLAIQDVYALDGQLRGHVSPPIPIQNALGQEHWYLRDSNWDADFSKSADRAAWFYEKETGINVDGVIGINMPMIQNLLTVTGPVQLSDYNDEITAENFFEKAVYYVHNDFFPGSTQKKDFLGAVTTAILAKITDPKSTNPIDLLKTVDTALTNKNLLLYFKNETAQSLIDRFQWSGKLPFSIGCQTKGAAGCIADFVYVVDANFGVNKVNYFIKRDENHTVAFQPDGSISEKLSIVYTNTAKTDSPGGGVYRNFSRIYLPPGTILSDITLDGNRIPTNPGGIGTVPYVEPSADQEGFSGISVVFDTPPGSSREITLHYIHEQTLSHEGAIQYDLIHQKQPGLFHTSTKTLFTYPSGWTITGERIRTVVSTLSAGERQDDFVAKSGQLEYNSSLLQDTYLRLTIRKQEEQ